MRFRIVRSLGLVLAATLAGGCASSPIVGSDHDRIVSSVQEFGIVEYFSDTKLARTTVDAPPQQAWDRLVTTYVGLGVPITTVDTTNHIAGALRAAVAHKIGTHPVSYVINCGALQGQNVADTYKVSLTALTQLTPSASPGRSQTIVRTTVTGFAKDPFGTYPDPFQCTSTGNLERDIAAALSSTK